MRRFNGIEGLRGWLAWTVAIGHIFQLTGQVPWAHQYWTPIHKIADACVLLFIIISGFVVTHLIVERQERYPVYLLRRFLRIFPVYLVALGLGIIGTYLAFDTFLAQPWGAMSPDTSRMVQQHEDLLNGRFLPHLLAHLTMLHGVIPSNILFESQYMFLSPAWSLSLEWQFYLLAPFIIAFARDWRYAPWLVLLAIGGHHAFRQGWLGVFILPSILPGAIFFFAIGIVSRLVVPVAAQISAYPLAAVILLAAMLAGNGYAPLTAWIAFALALILHPAPTDLVSQWIKNSFNVLFESRIPQRLGAMSYSTYILHVPLIQMLAWVAINQWHLQPKAALAAVLISGIPTILVASVLAHRYVELPGIRLGKALLQHRTNRARENDLAKIA
jgi:peptidoglycan/LPS O-acetylase OafA/YrhL